MLIINNDVVAELLSMRECIEAQETAFGQMDSGAAAHRPRIDMYIPCGRDDGYYRWGTMEGTNNGVFAIRMKSDIMTWPRDAAGNWTEDKYCIEPGTYCGLVMLFSALNGEPLAIINDGQIQHMRVGGGAGLGAKNLAREDASTVGMLGSGGMARTYLDAFCAVRDIKHVKVYSPTKANREAYAVEMSARFQIEVEPVDSARDAVRGADILATATDSMTPTFETDWLEPGMHVTNLGPNEVAPEVIDRCDVKIRQGVPGIQIAESDRVKAGVGHSPMAILAGTEEELERLPTSKRSPGFQIDCPDYCDLIAGRAPGRISAEQITYYHNVGNQGLQFSSVGGLVYNRAKEAGLGHEIPTEWFVQDIRD